MAFFQDTREAFFESQLLSEGAISMFPAIGTDRRADGVRQS
jgi:hypothetical protein